MPAKKPKPTPKQIVLNEEQQAVVSALSGVWCCLSGPGSGKTQVVSARYAKLIQDGVPPENILSLSFTKGAAKNLQGRVEEQTSPLSINRTVAGSVTFHSLALSFAQTERDEFDFTIAEFPLATEPVANKLAGEAARRYELDFRTLRPRVSLWKRSRVSASQAVRDAEAALNAKELKLALAYKEYDKRCRAEGLLDFDSLMYQMVEILSKKKDVRDRWQYQYVMADESQDNCITDWQLLKLLTEQHGNLLCVGDPGQSVFGFRGASPKLFLEMELMFPGTTKLFLATNYRSSKDLVDFLKEIGPVPELASKFTTQNPGGPAPIIRGFANPVDEAAFVVSCIKEGL